MFAHPNRLALAVVALAAAAIAPARAEPAFPGPVRAKVIRVLDGDTFVAEAHLWPGHVLTVNVRLRGIDAPEMRARCEAERVAAEEARSALADVVAGRTVAISNIAGAKYYGRVLADVATPDGELAPALLRRSVVRPYGSGRRQPWC
jgi:endonuclease YncB( thermonuclease family)